MSDLALKLLHRDEGFRKSAYQDSLGYWTVGIGRMIDARKGGGITLEEAEYLLGHDISSREQELDSRIPWWRSLNEVRQAVLLSMAFQMGVPGLMLFENTLKAVEEGRFSNAADLMLKSKWATQAPLRAHRLSEAMRTGLAEALQLDEDPPVS